MKEKIPQSVFHLLPVFLVALSLFVCAKFLNEVKAFDSNGNDKQTNTISVSGDGEVYGTPDIATISFSVRDTEKTVASAQTNVSKKVSTAIDFLTKNGVQKKDIKTTGTGFNPQYQYDNTICRDGYCPPTKPPTISGYEVSNSISVTVRNIDAVGKIISGLGDIGVTDLYGPNFSIENQDALRAAARKMAITKARMKAVVLARDLGVTLGDIASFSESGNNPPMMYATAKLDMGSGGGSEPMPVSPGENKISSSVNIVYEIK